MRFPEEGQEKWREEMEMSDFLQGGWNQGWLPRVRVKQVLGPVEGEVR